MHKRNLCRHAVTVRVSVTFAFPLFNHHHSSYSIPNMTAIFRRRRRLQVKIAILPAVDTVDSRQKPHTNGPLYSNTVVGTLAVDGHLGGLKDDMLKYLLTYYSRDLVVYLLGLIVGYFR